MASKREKPSLQKQVDDLRECLTTALVWIASSAHAPLRGDEVKRLIKMAEGSAADGE